VTRLPLAVAPLFEEWLSRHFPDLKKKVLNPIRALRGGRLNAAEFGSRGRIQSLFALACRKAGLSRNQPALSVQAFRRPQGRQLPLNL